MMAIGKVNRIAKNGLFTLPISLRKDFNILVGDLLEILVDEDNSIILRKYYPACLFCEGYEGVTVYKRKNVCKACVAEICSIK